LGIGVYLLLALICLGVALSAFLIVASPVDLVRDRLIAHVKARTGRDLAVRGGASLTFFPSFGIAMRDVELSPPPGMAGAGTTQAQAIDARISWLPLLRQQIVVEALTVRRPVVELAIDASGRKSWEFAFFEDLLPSPVVRFAQAGTRPAFGEDIPPALFEALKSASSREGKGGKTALAGAFSLAELKVEEGSIRYSDARNGKRHEANAVNLRVGFARPSAPMNVSGNMIWLGEKVSLDGMLDSAGAVLERRPVRARLKLSSRTVDAAYDGALSLTDVTALDGRLTAKTTAGRALVQWLGDIGTRAPAFTNAAVDGTIRSASQSFALSDATITMDGSTATGAVSVETGKERPFIRADMQLSSFDLDAFLSARRGGHNKPGRERAPDKGEAAAPPASSIDDILKRQNAEGPPRTDGQPQVRGFMHRSGGAWSTDPIHLVGLTALDLDGRFQIAKTTWRDLKFGASRVHVTLDGGRLKADIIEAQLYEGRGKGVLTVENEGGKAVVSLDAAMGGIAAGPLMKDLAEFDWVEGRGNLALAITGQGRTEREIVETLGGKAEFKVADGAVLGWDVTQSLRELRQGKLPDLDRNPARKTAFQELSGTLAIANGVATNRDLKLTGQPVTLSGAGTIALPDRAVDYTVRPKLAANHGGGSGIANDLMNVEIPVHIRGPWTKPSYSADVNSVLKDPRTAEKLQQLGRQVREGNVDEAIKGVLGDGPEAEKKAAKAKELLKRFMKQ
jgi:AsmA protein